MAKSRIKVSALLSGVAEVRGLSRAHFISTSFSLRFPFLGFQWFCWPQGGQSPGRFSPTDHQLSFFTAFHHSILARPSPGFAIAVPPSIGDNEPLSVTCSRWHHPMVGKRHSGCLASAWRGGMGGSCDDQVSRYPSRSRSPCIIIRATHPVLRKYTQHIAGSS